VTHTVVGEDGRTNSTTDTFYVRGTPGNDCRSLSRGDTLNDCQDSDGLGGADPLTRRSGEFDEGIRHRREPRRNRGRSD